MDEIIRNYTKTKLTLVLKIVMEEYGDTPLLGVLAVEEIEKAANDLKVELVFNKNVSKVISIKEINDAIEEVQDAFIKEILNN